MPLITVNPFKPYDIVLSVYASNVHTVQYQVISPQALYACGKVHPLIINQFDREDVFHVPLGRMSTTCTPSFGLVAGSVTYSNDLRGSSSISNPRSNTASVVITVTFARAAPRQ